MAAEEVGILALFLGLGLFMLLIWAGLYVYTALAYQSIYRKSGHKKPWMAWIPIVNVIPALELGGFHWAWVFLVVGMFIPVLGVLASLAFLVLWIIAHVRIFRNAGYHPALIILLFVPVANLITLGVVAWQKNKYPKKVKAKAKKKK